jgi:hypothetical protein
MSKQREEKNITSREEKIKAVGGNIDLHFSDVYAKRVEEGVKKKKLGELAENSLENEKYECDLFLD